jgi:transcriptional regulator of acetoin/glycerol metabolism
MMMNEEIVVAGLPLQFPKPTAGTQLPTLAEWNQRYIEYVLSFTKGKKTAAARILGINRRTLYRRKKAKGQNTMVMQDGGSLSDIMDDTLTGVPAGHQVQ